MQLMGIWRKEGVLIYVGIRVPLFKILHLFQLVNLFIEGLVFLLEVVDYVG